MDGSPVARGAFLYRSKLPRIIIRESLLVLYFRLLPWSGDDAREMR